jgi:hypothetical protein
MSLNAEVKHVFSYDGGEIQMIDEHTMITKCGSTLKFSSTVNNSQHFLVHNKASHIASFDCNSKVSEIALAACEQNAEISIYSFPEKVSSV